MLLLRNLRPALALGFIIGWTSLAHAAPLFGPKVFTRDPGAPPELVESFEFRGQASSLRLIVNNGLPDGTRRVSSAWVSLNGEQLLTPSDFNQQVTELRKPVALQPANELRVRLAGVPGGLLTISISAVVGPAGGFIVSPAGARLTIPPGAAADEIAIGLRDVSLADTGISLPDGYDFLGAVAVDLDGPELSAAADLGVPVSQPPAGRAITARVREIGDLKRLVLVDTASVTDGLLHTNSPPFPGVRTGGTYLFTQMPPNLGILGITAQSSTGPLKGALVETFVHSVDAATPSTTLNQSLQSLATFIGETDSTGLATVPGAMPRSSVALVAMTPASPASLQATVSTATLPDLPDIVSGGFLPSWLQNLLLQRLNIDPNLLSNLPPRCPCTALLVNPDRIPDSAIPFRPGNTRHLQVFCSPSEPDVTRSGTSDLFDLLTAGLSAHITGYHSLDPNVATVSPDGSVTAVSPGSTDVYVWTLFTQFFRTSLGPLTGVSAFRCSAAGGVHPVVVSAHAQVAIVGSGSGNVQSSPHGIACPPDCDAYFPPRQSVTLTASPVPDSRFVQWGGDCSGSGTATSATLTMDVNRSCTAEFRLRPRLTVAKTGRGTGTVASQPSGISCGSNCTSRFDEGDAVTLTASADPGSQFIRWTGDCTGTTATATVTMNGDRACTAEFDGAIRVVSASYGSVSCRNPVGNVTSTVAGLCDGKVDCTVYVHNSVFGDPSYGCAKDFIAQWQCGSDPGVRSVSHGAVAGEGYSVDLTCR